MLYKAGSKEGLSYVITRWLGYGQLCQPKNAYFAQVSILLEWLCRRASAYVYVFSVIRLSHSTNWVLCCSAELQQPLKSNQPSSRDAPHAIKTMSHVCRFTFRCNVYCATFQKLGSRSVGIRIEAHLSRLIRAGQDTSWPLQTD